MLIELIHNYGYWIVFFGSMIEGESIILTAGMLCSHGVLSFYKVCLLSFIGTCIADQLLYNLGYYVDSKFLEKFNFSKNFFLKLKPIVIKYQTAYILSFRFIYGIRILSPILIGMVKINQKKYMILNVIASIIWAVISCGIGYMIGSFTKELNFNFKYLMLIGTMLILLLLLISKLIANYILKKNNLA